MKKILVFFTICLLAIFQLGAQNEMLPKMSTKELKKLAKEENYVFNDLGATQNYIAHIESLIKKGAIEEAAKAAMNLANDAKKAKQCKTRQLAVGLWIDASPEKSIEIALDALKKEECSIYRKTAMTAVAKYNHTEHYYSEIIKVFVREKKSDIKIDIADWVAQQAENEKEKVLMQFMVQPFIDGLDTKDVTLQKAIAGALVALDNNKAIVPFVGLIVNIKEPTITIAKNALIDFSSHRKEIIDLLADNIMGANDTAKVAMLELLAVKNANEHLGVVIGTINLVSDSVKIEAYKTMAAIVEPKDIETISALLKNTEDQYISLVNDALLNALGQLPNNEQYQLMCKLINETDKEYLFYDALANTGNVYAHQYIANKLKSNNMEERNAAERIKEDVLNSLGKVDDNKQQYLKSIYAE